jgi:hypothetical protein
LASPAEADSAAPAAEIDFARSIVKARLETERTGTEVEWRNPETDNVGRMRIVETQILDRGLPCRWYEWSVETDSGSDIETEGKGCRLANGEWLLEETAIVREIRTVPVPLTVVAPEPEPQPADPMAGISFTRPGIERGDSAAQDQ